jgi:uncharacterized membrane protein YdjX (TVP38/TMEM64 family)
VNPAQPHAGLQRVAETLVRHAPLLRAASIATILISLLLIQRQLPLARMIKALGGWVESLGVWGPLWYGVLYALAVVLLIPGSMMTLAAGALFGLPVATITVSLASTTGAALAFLVARYLARAAVARQLEKRPLWAAVDRAIGQNGWKIVALLRLSPVVPFNLQNYLYGVTSIKFWPCVLTSWVTMLPGSLLYVYLGYAGRVGLEAAAGHATRARSPAEWAMLAVGLVATLVVTLYLTRIARRVFREQTELETAVTAEPAGNPEAPKSLSHPRPWDLLVWALAAVLALGCAIFGQLNPGFLERLVSSGVVPR